MEQNKAKEQWHSPENLLAIVRILAIAGAAGWAIFLFFRFEEKERELNVAMLEGQNLQIELDTQLSHAQLSHIQSVRLPIDNEVKITDLGPVDGGPDHLYMVEYTYTITNRGKLPSEVTYAIVSAYTAPLDLSEQGAFLVINDFHEEGGVKWKPLFSKGYYYAPKWKEGMQFSTASGETAVQRGGGGTSELDAGEDSKGSVDVVLRASVNDFVGFEARIGVNGAKDPGDRWRTRLWRSLSEGTGHGMRIEGGNEE